MSSMQQVRAPRRHRVPPRDVPHAASTLIQRYVSQNEQRTRKALNFVMKNRSVKNTRGHPLVCEKAGGIGQ